MLADLTVLVWSADGPKLCTENMARKCCGDVQVCGLTLTREDPKCRCTPNQFPSRAQQRLC